MGVWDSDHLPGTVDSLYTSRFQTGVEGSNRIIDPTNAVTLWRCGDTGSRLAGPTGESERADGGAIVRVNAVKPRQ